MRVSLNWVEQLLGVERLPLSDQDLFERLISHVAEIEEIEAVGPNWDHLVVGDVLSVEQHPNADKLRCCKVAVGKDEPAAIVWVHPTSPRTKSMRRPTWSVVSIPGRDGSLQEITIKRVSYAASQATA